MEFYTDEDLQEIFRIGWKQAKALKLNTRNV